VRLPWRRPQPALTDNDPSYYSRCFYHGPEPVNTPDVFVICHECGHVWTTDALVAAHNDLIAERGGDTRVHRRRPDHVPLCPLCAHDF
jgi:hypothetical protein